MLEQRLERRMLELRKEQLRLHRNHRNLLLLELLKEQQLRLRRNHRNLLLRLELRLELRHRNHRKLGLLRRRLERRMLGLLRLQHQRRRPLLGFGCWGRCLSFQA